MMKRMVPLLWLVWLAGLVFTGPVAAQDPSQVETIEIAQVDNSAYPQVTVYVRVLDAAGRRVPGLGEDQFRILEDGAEVDLVDFSGSNLESIRTLMLMDVSGSMGEGSKMEGARQAALAFVDLMRSQDQVALLTFNHAITQRVGFTTDQGELRRQIGGLGPGGGTAWYDAVIAAAERVKDLGGRKSLLLLTDGLDENSSRSFQAAIEAALESETPVYTIGLGPAGEYDERRLKEIAAETQGHYYHAPSAAELEQLYRQIAQSTQEEYVLTYLSPRPSYDGTRRDIDITVGSAAVRSGYVEQHLLNIESNFWIGLVCLMPLLAALVLPVFARAVLPKGAPAAPLQPLEPPPVPAIPLGSALDDSSPPVSPGPIASPGCPHCGRQLQPAARFCPGCGRPVTPAGRAEGPPVAPSFQCPYCGNALRPGAKFCNTCGRRL